MIIKCHKDKKRISLTKIEKKSYERDIRDNTNPDQANNQY